MRRTVCLTLLVFLMSSFAGAAGVEAIIEEECPVDYEPLIAMASPDETYSHPIPPENNQDGYEVCVQGIEDVSIGDECEKNTGFYIHSEHESYSHFSIYPAYNVPVCTDRMQTQVNQTCPEGTETLFSVSGEHNAHIAAPDVFDSHLCGFLEEPENITLEMEFGLTDSDEVYFDGEEISEGEERLAEFPYIVAEGDGHIAGIVSDDMIRVERITGDDTNTVLMEKERGEFILPFTSGGINQIERRQELVLERSFLDHLSPSFGFFMPEQLTVRVALLPDATLESSIRLPQGSHTLRVEKIGDNTVSIELE